MLDPHTAVAKYVADRHNSDVPTIISATAHFSKFSESILDAFGMHAPADNPKELMKGVIQMTDKPAVHECLWNDVKMARHHQQVSTLLHTVVRDVRVTRGHVYCRFVRQISMIFVRGLRSI